MAAEAVHGQIVLERFDVVPVWLRSYWVVEPGRSEVATVGERYGLSSSFANPCSKRLYE